jgi:hypothetical protein
MVTLFGGIASESWGASDEAYLPLATADIQLSDGDVAAFMRLVERFSADSKFTEKRGDFPKEGRTVFNETIQLTGETFFHFDNFRRTGEFRFGAYSHETPEIWTASWEKLLHLIEEQFGPASVQRLIPPKTP